MAVDIRQMIDAPEFDGIQESTVDDEDSFELSASEVIERVNEILGYDIFEVELMTEGYAELSDEMLTIAQQSFSAQAETLTPE